MRHNTALGFASAAVLLIVCLVFVAPPSTQAQQDFRVCPAGQEIDYFWFRAYCDDCDEGLYSDEPDQNSCKVCQPGTFSNQQRNTACRECAEGTYQPNERQDRCLSCPSGKFVDEKGQSACEECAEGTFADEEGLVNCKQCAPGSYQPFKAKESCEKCAAGTYADAPGQSNCKDCTAGTFAGNVGLTQCSPCPEGSFSDADKATACKLCPAGSFSEGTGKTSCQQCDEGTFTDGEGKSSCSDCSPGFYADSQGSTGCKACGQGTYQPSSKATDCLDCDPGFFNDQTGRSECKACPANTFSASTGAISCQQFKNCPRGTYITGDGTATSDRSCQACDVGKFSDTINSQECKDCPDGTFQDETGQSSCKSAAQNTNCPAGTYIKTPATQTTAAVCEDCAQGFYTDSANQASCLPWSDCDAGFYVSGLPRKNQDRQCTECPAGSISTGTNSQTCQLCDGATSYQNLPRQTSCKQVSTCPAGTFVQTASTSSSDAVCASCQLGSTFSTLPNQPLCNDVLTCTAGQRESVAPTRSSDRQCTACNGVTEFQDQPGQTSCKAVRNCFLGEGAIQSPTPSSDRVCQACTSGTYSDTIGDEPCKLASQCPAGKELAEPASTTRDVVCRTCGQNFYKPTEGNSPCLPATLCNSTTAIATVDLTPSSDRVCTPVQRCVDGIDLSNNEECSCPSGEACSSCISQGRDGGYLLIKTGAFPPSDPVDPANPCVNINNPQDPLQDIQKDCAELCRSTDGCRSFFLFLTGGASGQCCMHSRYQDRNWIARSEGSYFALEVCDQCADGFVLVDGLCQSEASGPEFNSLPSRLNVALTLDVGSTVIDVDATPDDDAGPVTYSMTSSSTQASSLSIDHVTGEITLASAFTSPELLLIQLVATDNRTSCSSVEKGRVVTRQGGCTTTKTLELAITTILSCPSDQNIYLDPAETQANLAWPLPSLPQFSRNVNLTNSLGQTQPPFNFAVGQFQVNYTTSTLDVGGSVSCEFIVTVQNGFELSVTEIGHFPASANPVDLIVDGDQISGTGLRAPAFAGRIVGQSFGIGLVSPPSKPFYLALKSKWSARLIISLSWCSSGTLTGSQGQLLPTQSFFDLVDTGISFEDTGSGFLPDGRCFVISARSEIITEPISFASMAISIDTSAAINRRRSIQNYEPVGTNIVAFRYTAEDAETAATDPGPMLILEDVEPPSWVGCPSVPVVGLAVVGQTTAPVFWDEPTAIDNVAVVSVDKSSQPGDVFSVVDSPHTVTYTASDGQQTSTCTFEVVVDFEQNTIALETGIPEPFTASIDVDPTLLFTEVSYDLIDSFASGLTFDATFENITAIELRISVPGGDTALARVPEDAVFAQYVFDLLWLSVDGTPPAADFDEDVQVTVSFEGFALDNAAGSENLVGLTQSFSIRESSVSVDPDTGHVAVEGFSPTFTRNMQFTAILVTLKFPSARDATALKQYAPAINSKALLRFFFDASSAVTAADLAASPLLVPIDNVPPLLQLCPTNITVPAQANETGTVVTWSEPIATDNRGQTFLTSNIASGSYFEIRPRSDPPQRVTYVVRDLFGNEASCSFFVRIVDQQPPDVVCPALQSFVLPEGEGSITAGPSVWSPVAKSDNSELDVTIVSPTGDVTLGVGPNVVEVVVQDTWGNNATCGAQVQVVDNEKPTVECPTLNPVSGNLDGSPTVVNWSPATASDNDRVQTITYSQAPGSTFPVGVTPVQVTATDSSGNSASCSFDVDVRESTSSGSTSSTSVIGGAAGGGGLLMIVIVVLIVAFIQQRNRYKYPQDWSQIFAMIEQLKNRSDEAREPREIARAAITILEELGRGAFGTVSKGLLKENPGIPGFLVAVKSLHPNAGASDRTELLEEAAIMAQFEHPHVVQLVGVVTVGRPLLVIVEFMEYGSLKSYLEKNDVPPEQKILFASDCAAGLKHIHDNCFVHRDVAARNVLVSSEKRCKISDFGLARDTAEDTYYRSRGGQLPVRWSAPEALEDRKFSEATDVWSFGVLLHEIWTKAEMPYNGWHNQKVWVEVAAGYRLPQPNGCPEDVYEQMRKCWDEEPELRPTFEDMASFFGKRYTELTGESPDGYLSVDDEGKDNTKRRRSLKKALGSFFKRRSSTDKASRRGSSDNGSTVVNPLFEEDTAVYDLGDADGRQAGDENAAMYDLGDGGDGAPPKPDNGAVIYDFGDEDFGPSDAPSRESLTDYGFDANDLTGVTVIEGADATSVPTDSIPQEPAPGQELYNNFATSEPIAKAIGPEDVGKRVRVRGYDCLGTLLFYGMHHERKTPRCGVELDEPEGINNGTVKGHIYFKCKDKHGVLCVPTKVTLEE